MRLRFGTLLFLVASLLLCSVSTPSAPFHEDVERVGLLLILGAIFGRTWCTLYIGGRKRQEIVVVGPYSLCRNPLYLFTLMGVTGIGLCSGMLSLGLLAFGIALSVFAGVITAEEAYLDLRFGPVYRSYCDQVPRWLPLGRWQGVAEVAMRPQLVVTTFLEASLMLLAFPMLEWVDRLHIHQLVPVLLRLP